MQPPLVAPLSLLSPAINLTREEGQGVDFLCSLHHLGKITPVSLNLSNMILSSGCPAVSSFQPVHYTALLYLSTGTLWFANKSVNLSTTILSFTCPYVHYDPLL